jgi:tRNA 2-thiouridine synthesizing protein A
MPQRVLDALGLKCPQPILKIALTAASMKLGDTLEVWGDCPTFEKDVRAWCGRLRKTLLSVAEDAGYKKRVQIQL